MHINPLPIIKMKHFFIVSLLLSAAIPSTFSQTVNGGDLQVTGYGSSAGVMKKTPTVKGYDRLGKAEYECVYRYDVVATKKNGETVNEEYATILQFNPSVAKFTDMTSYRADSIAAIPNAPIETIEKLANDRAKSEFFFSGEVFQNYPEGKTTYTDIIVPNYVEYAEDFAPFEWEITEDTLTVSTYPCIKATCEYGGRKWTAWFTEDIPVSYGPWKFAGLPGLIMKVTDDDNIHTFTATSLSKADDAIVKVQNTNIQHTDRDKFVSAKNYFEVDPMHRVPVESITSVDVLKDGGIRINGVPLIQRKNGYTPIELK